MASWRAFAASGLVAGMLTLVGCTAKEDATPDNTPVPPAGGGGIPTAPSPPAKKAGFVCEKCGYRSDVAGEHCDQPMKKIDV